MEVLLSRPPSTRLSSPGELCGVHALLSRQTQARNTHTQSQTPGGLRCLEVNRIIWSCSVLTLRQLQFHNRGGLGCVCGDRGGALFPHSTPHPKPPARRGVNPSASHRVLSCSEAGGQHLSLPTSAPQKPKPTAKDWQD